MQVLHSEGIIRLIEDVPTTVTYRNYSGPGKSCSWNRRYGYQTTIALTHQRFVVSENGRKIVNLFSESDYWAAVSVALHDEYTMSVVANVTAFPNRLNGEVELWLATPLASTLLTELTSWRSLHSSGESQL